MTRARRLVPAPRDRIVPETPQCSVSVPPPSHNPNWRKDRYAGLRPDLCQRRSTVEIDGKAYCNLHGGAVALQKLLGED